jgi:hypothetical protein
MRATVLLAALCATALGCDAGGLIVVDRRDTAVEDAGTDAPDDVAEVPILDAAKAVEDQNDWTAQR